MRPSLQALLAGVVDYAGLFPPARLPMDQAVRNYARYRHEPESWMLARFVCPVARLGELDPLVAELFASGPPLLLAVLGRGGSTLDEFLIGLQTDLQGIAEFRGRHGDRVIADAYEVKLPAPAAGGHRALVMTAADGIEAQGPPSLTPFYEIALGPDWRAAVAAVVADLARANESARAAGRRRLRPAGFKLRCGGTEPSAFPTPEQVAFTITTCRDQRVPLKFTAGLHHPIRRFRAEVQAPMHGFLNVFVAGVLAHARGLGEAEVRAVVEDEDAAHFHFDEQGLRWREIAATAEEILTARQQAVVSFGSCSFDEPREDLRALGLLG